MPNNLILYKTMWQFVMERLEGRPLSARLVQCTGTNKLIYS